MSFPKLTFPLTIESTGTEYWINENGPFKFGEAATSFLTHDRNYKTAKDAKASERELEMRLQSFRKEDGTFTVIPGTCQEFEMLAEQDFAGCKLRYDYRQAGRDVVLVERATFDSLHDFLYADLGKGALLGNAPRKCQLCGKWFFHERGDLAVYCDNIAPGEIEKTCREVGARTTFENKLQTDQTWAIYKRAYKKYYARVMKRNMSRKDFDAWVEGAAKKRAVTSQALEVTKSAEDRAALIEKLREELNRL